MSRFEAFTTAELILLDPMPTMAQIESGDVDPNAVLPLASELYAELDRRGWWPEDKPNRDADLALLADATSRANEDGS